MNNNNIAVNMLIERGGRSGSSTTRNTDSKTQAQINKELGDDKIPGIRKIPKPVRKHLKGKKEKPKIEVPDSSDRQIPFEEADGQFIDKLLNLEASEGCATDAGKFFGAMGVGAASTAVIYALAKSDPAQAVKKTKAFKGLVNKIRSMSESGKTSNKVSNFEKKIKQQTPQFKDVADAAKKGAKEQNSMLKKLFKLRNIPLALFAAGVGSWGLSKVIKISGLSDDGGWWLVTQQTLETYSLSALADKVLLATLGTAFLEVDREETGACIAFYVIVFGALLLTMAKFTKSAVDDIQVQLWRKEFFKNAEILNNSFLKQLDAGFAVANNRATKKFEKEFKKIFKDSNNKEPINRTLALARKKLFDALTTGDAKAAKQALKKLKTNLKNKKLELSQDEIKASIEILEKYADDLGTELTLSYQQVLKLNATRLKGRESELRFSNENLKNSINKISKKFEKQLKNWADDPRAGIDDLPTSQIGDVMISINQLAISGNPLLARKLMNDLTLRLRNAKVPKNAKTMTSGGTTTVGVSADDVTSQVIAKAENILETTEFERLLDTLIVPHLTRVGKQMKQPYKKSYLPDKDFNKQEAQFWGYKLGGKDSIMNNSEFYAMQYLDSAIAKSNAQVLSRTSDPARLIGDAVARRAKGRVTREVRRRIAAKVPDATYSMNNRALKGMTAIVVSSVFLAALATSGGNYKGDVLVPDSPFGFSGPVPKVVLDIMNTSTGMDQYQKLLDVLNNNKKDSAKLGRVLFTQDKKLDEFIDYIAKENFRKDGPADWNWVTSGRLQKFLENRKPGFKKAIENSSIRTGNVIEKDIQEEDLEKLAYLLANIYIFKSSLRNKLVEYYENVHTKTDNIEERKKSLRTKVFKFQRADFRFIGTVIGSQRELSEKYKKALKDVEEEEEEKRDSSFQNLEGQEISRETVLVIGDSTANNLIATQGADFRGTYNRFAINDKRGGLGKDLGLVKDVSVGLPGYTKHVALGAAQTDLIYRLLEQKMQASDFVIPKTAIISMGYNDIAGAWPKAEIKARMADLRSKSGTGSRRRQEIRQKKLKLYEKQLKNHSLPKLPAKTMRNFEKTVELLIQKGVKDIRIIGTKASTRKQRSQKSPYHISEDIAKQLSQKLNGLSKKYSEVLFIPNEIDSEGNDPFPQSDGVHFSGQSAKNLMNVGLRGDGTSTNLDEEEVRALATCIQIETVGGQERYKPEAVAAIAFARQKSSVWGDNLKNVVSGGPQPGKSLGTGWLNVRKYKNAFRRIYRDGPTKKCMRLARKYLQDKEGLMAKYNYYDSYIHASSMPKTKTDPNYNSKMVYFDFNSKEAMAAIRNNPGSVGKRYIQRGILRAIRKGKAFFVGRHFMAHDQVNDLKITTGTRREMKNIDAKYQLKRRRKAGGTIGTNNQEKQEEVKTMNKKTLRDLVSEVLNENSGTGYAKYPYHSNEYSEQEPDEDYSIEWSSLIEDVCGHKRKNVDGDPNTYEDTAVEVAKIFVKDTELFREVLEAAGTNKSLGVEIMRQLKQAMSKENK